jgi:hypothetical protein
MPTGRNLTMGDVPRPRSPSSLLLQECPAIGTYSRFSEKCLEPLPIGIPVPAGDGSPSRPRLWTPRSCSPHR